MRLTRFSIILAAALTLVGAAGIHTLPPAVAQTPGCAVSPTELTVDQEEQSALEMINALRAGSRAPALSLSPSLGQAAALKSVTMAASGSFGHDDPGRSFSQRVRDCGYRATPDVAENIAVGVDTGQAVVHMWRDSPAHHRIMLDPSMKAIGISRVRGTYGWYWTANFGGVVDGASPSSSAASQPPASTRTVAPAGAAVTPAGNQTGSLQIGTMARVSTDDGDCLNVRRGPGRAATIVVCLPDGSAVTITGGPISADGIDWWMIDGLGWAAGEYLRPAVRR
ncbi:MAG: CAP domain-containing protein [Dehalococcoidia bacterium]